MKVNARIGGLILLASFCLALVLSCDKPGPTDGPAYSVSGTVTDSITSAPIDSALIAIGDSTATQAFTDTSGYYRFATWPGKFTLFVCKPGYNTKSQSIDLRSNLTGIDFQLVPNK